MRQTHSFTEEMRLSSRLSGVSHCLGTVDPACHFREFMGNQEVFSGSHLLTASFQSKPSDNLPQLPGSRSCAGISPKRNPEKDCENGTVCFYTAIPTALSIPTPLVESFWQCFPGTPYGSNPCSICLWLNNCLKFCPHRKGLPSLL